MNQKTAVQPATNEVKVSEVLPPAVEKITSVPAVAEPVAPMEQVATAAAGKKVAAKKPVTVKPTKKAVAEKPDPTPKAPTKSVKQAAPEAETKVTAAPKVEKSAKAKKPKLVRDSFTIPEDDYALFTSLKQRALATGTEVKKSEVLRAGLSLLAKLDDAELVKAIGLVERIKTGRPKK